MSLLFRNWLPEGYYEEDSSGDLRKLEDADEIRECAKSGNLLEHDGMCMSKVYDENIIENKSDEELIK